MAALLLGAASCSQEENPKYHNPNADSFKINTPGLQDQALYTTGDMQDASTFNLFTSQPDYGFSGVCNYSAIVSLDPTCPDPTTPEGKEKSFALPNENPTSAIMAIKTFELANALNKLLGIPDQEAFDANQTVKQPLKAYFRAVCEIPGIEGSRVVTSNVTSYNNIHLVYAIKQPGWIYICGDVQTTGGDDAVKNGFTGPAASAFDFYKDFRLYEPEDMIGEKLYVGHFWLTPKSGTFNPTNPDDESQFRFFTELAGWSTDYSVGSNINDFYCENTELVDDSVFYEGTLIMNGLGNWGISVAEPKEVTIVVDLTGLKCYFKLGDWDVTFSARTPSFEAK